MKTAALKTQDRNTCPFHTRGQIHLLVRSRLNSHHFLLILMSEKNKESS